MSRRTSENEQTNQNVDANGGYCSLFDFIIVFDTHSLSLFSCLLFIRWLRFENRLVHQKRLIASENILFRRSMEYREVDV